jgi:hypothetical protein
MSSCGDLARLDVGRPIAAPLEQCAELLGVDLVTICKAAVNVEPCLRADGTRISSLMQWNASSDPRRTAGGEGGTSTADERPVAHPAKHRPDQDDWHLQEPPWPRPPLGFAIGLSGGLTASGGRSFTRASPAVPDLKIFAV